MLPQGDDSPLASIRSSNGTYKSQCCFFTLMPQAVRSLKAVCKRKWLEMYNNNVNNNKDNNNTAVLRKGRDMLTK